MSLLTGQDVLKLHVAQLRLALGNQVADDEVARAPLDDHLRQVSRLRRRLVLFRLGNRDRNFTVTLALCLTRSHRNIVHQGWRGIRDHRWVVHRPDSAARGDTSGANQDDQQRQRK